MAGVLVIGVAVVDFVFAVDTLPSLPSKYRAQTAEIVGGGCAANAAVAIARLGGQAVLGARLGDDAIGDMIVEDLGREGVDCALVQLTQGARSSFSSVYVDNAGERQIMNFRGQGLTSETGWISQAPRMGAVLADTRWSEGAKRALALAAEWGVPGVVDAEAPMDPAALVGASHVAFSRDGLLDFTGETRIEAGLIAADTYLPGWVCVTDGAAGTFHLKDGRIVQTRPPEVSVRDTLAAGDVWHGAFALALAEGRDEETAIRFANITAALKCTTLGGRAGCPNRVTVENLMKEDG
ncbi:MAG: PfkB family carbohydrate kinase [Marivivens sp.]